jgi:hypothetical protein
LDGGLGDGPSGRLGGVVEGLVRVSRATDEEATAGNNPVFLTMRPRLMTGTWNKSGHPLEPAAWIGAFRRFDYRLKDKKGRPIQRENAVMFLDRCAEEGWLCVRNLTDDLTRLQASLDEVGDERPSIDSSPSA